MKSQTRCRVRNILLNQEIIILYLEVTYSSHKIDKPHILLTLQRLAFSMTTGIIAYVTIILGHEWALYIGRVD